MPTFFQRPENALKRANEFIDVGKKQRALDALYDVIKSKKHRTWQKIHEPIMEKYLELCVELKKSHIAKEGLYQYKNICQQVNIKSLEDVVRKYLAMAEQKTEEARQESHQTVVDVDDLDILQTPENLLLSAVSGEDTQDRTDRAILTPWVKFLWESYRQCLDLLRNNNSVEKLYQDIAQQAFKFCLKYARKTEFRKLCDNLRTHLGHIHKHQNQQRAINLNNPESQAMHLETRLVQLDSAIQMELWQEAFKAVEDIHGLITLSKKPPKPSLMANYYQKLGLVFWKSGNFMFHACAWHRLFHLSREQRKNLSHDELQKLASNVMCATLSIPIPPARTKIDSVLDMDDNTLEKQRRLATLLGLTSPPTRAGLVKDLIKFNVMQYVHPELQNLYRYLEVEFHPLKLSAKVSTSLEFIGQNPDLECYVSALQEITITRLVKQISQIYQTIEFARLAKLAPFANKFRLERVIVDAAKNLELQVRIDHKTESLSFGTDLGVAQKEDVPEGPYLQSMPSEHIRNQLTHMAQALDKAMTIISPKEIQQMKREELRIHIVQTYRQTAKKEHLRILQRRQIIEERKEELEQVTVQREREEAELLEEQKRRQIEAEMARLEREAEEREKQRKKEEHKEIQRKVAKERLEQLKSTTLGARAFADLSEDAIADMDVDDILAKQVEQLEKEKRELQEKLKSQEKKIDYFERAKRIEEIPLWELKHQEDQVKAKELWEIEEAERIENSKKEREVALQHRDRLSRIIPDKNEFVNKLRQARMSVYKEKFAKFEKDLAEERAQRLKDRKARRKEERKQKWITEREEEEQRKHDEELKRQREEEERLAMEKREEEEREYNERLRKLEEIEERKRQREREVEEKLEAERRGMRRFDDRRQDDDKWKRDGSPEGRERPTAWKPPSREGGWREREKQKTDRWRKTSAEEEAEDNARVDAPPKEDSWRKEAPQEGGWRAAPPPDTRRDDRLRDDRGPPSRDIRGPPPRDERDHPREDPREEGGWRRDRAPPRDDGGWRRDRGPREENPVREEQPWRASREDRDGRGPPARDEWRREERREERSRDDRPPRDDGWRRDGGDRPPPRDDWRRAPPREEQEGGDWRRAPPREREEKGWRGGERGERGERDRAGVEEGGGWRDRGPPSRDIRGPPREERGPPRDLDDRGPPRGPPRDEWRREERAPPRGRDDRGPPPAREDSWRGREARGSPSKDTGRPEERMPPRATRNEEGGESEGWTTVKR